MPDDLYRAVRPMLAVSEGRMVCLSTPYGKRGFFYKEWTEGGDDWHRIEIKASEVPRIKPEFLEQERRSLGEAFYRQEFCCSFETLQGLVYPDLAQCVVGELPAYLAALDGGRAGLGHGGANSIWQDAYHDGKASRLTPWRGVRDSSSAA